MDATQIKNQAPPKRSVADMLREAADLLELQGANPFRVNAYRRASQTVATLGEDLSQLYAQQGIEGLTALPGIGTNLAAAISEILLTGRWNQLERLRGTMEPEQVFQSIPGVGPELARQLHDTLNVDTLEALEIAVNDGRVDSVPGIGPRRAAILRASLGAMLARRRPSTRPTVSQPSVDILLDVDHEYQEKAKVGKLPKIAPKRFNPAGEAWLPILHARRDDWEFTALYSNTARAHDLRKTTDWVVMYFHTDTQAEGQCTVVTETHGPLSGKRVVRGREDECRVHYQESQLKKRAG